MTDPTKPYSDEQIEAHVGWLTESTSRDATNAMLKKSAAMLRQLLAERSAAEKERDDARADYSGVMDEIAAVGDMGELSEAQRITFGGKLMEVLGATMVPWFYANGGRNLIASGIVNRTDGTKFDLILQRADRKCVSEVLSEQAADIAALRANADSAGEIVRTFDAIARDVCAAIGIEKSERPAHWVLGIRDLHRELDRLRAEKAERDAALAEVKAHEDAAEDRAIARDLARMPRNVR